MKSKLDSSNTCDYVRVLRDDKPSYIMKAVGKPKNQHGGFGGIANHAGVSGYTYTVNGGSCSPK